MNILKKIKDIFYMSSRVKATELNTNKLSMLVSEIENIKVNQGIILSNLNFYHKKNEILDDIKKSEFKIFSQWGDDGIIDFLVKHLEITDKRFVEFGVENYTECNTKFLLISNNWKGLIMDGSFNNMNSLRKSQLYWKFDITAIDIFVTKENINEILKKNNFDGEIGLLHIDIDGNDYWIWEQIEVSNPIIVIVEYNSLFGYDKPFSTIYSPDFLREKNHYSKLLYGTSLLSLCDLAEIKGYSFVGCNTNGNNAYFVRKDKLNGLKPVSIENGYVESRFSESRDQTGNFSFLRGSERLNILRGCKIYNTRTKQIEEI